MVISLDHEESPVEPLPQDKLIQGHVVSESKCSGQPGAIDVEQADDFGFAQGRQIPVIPGQYKIHHPLTDSKAPRFELGFRPSVKRERLEYGMF